MASSETAIWNLALAAAKSSKFIEAPEERSLEADLCRLHYAETRDLILSAADWPFARKRLPLILVGTPPPEWAYRYELPADCVSPRLIADGLVVRRLDQRILFAIENDGTGDGRVLLLNETAPTLIYTMRAKNPVIYPPAFVEALAWKLASNIARPLSCDVNLCRELLQTAEAMIGRAAARAYNEEKHGPPPESELSLSRKS